MNRARRIRWLLLALLLTVSQVVLVGHLAAHAQPMVEHCALCASHAEPQAAVPVADVPSQARVVASRWGEPPSAAVASATPLNVRSRAPPVRSS